VIFGVREQRTWSTFDVAQEGVRPVILTMLALLAVRRPKEAERIRTLPHHCSSRVALPLEYWYEHGCAASGMFARYSPTARGGIMSDQQQTKQELIALEQRWMEAWKQHDIDTCAQILADDFTITNALSRGELADKAQWLALAAGPYECQSFAFNRIDVRLYGQTAVINAWYSQHAAARGADWSGEFLITDVWVESPAGWRVVARHSSRPLAEPISR
jgi:ketosteroid isomerase-like protein